MRKFANVVRSFIGGVVTPRMYVRDDISIYRNALRSGRNWIVSPHGGIVFREGLRYERPTLTGDFTRIFQFHRGGDESDALVEVGAGQYQVLFQDEQGELQQMGATQTARYTQDELEKLYFDNRATLGCLVHPNHPPVYITINETGELEQEEIQFTGIPKFNYNDFKSPNVASTSGSYTLVFETGWNTQQHGYYVSLGNVLAGFTAAGIPDNEVIPTAYRWVIDDSAANAANLEAALQVCIDLLGFTASSSVTVTADTLYNYNVTLTGPASGLSLSVIPSDHLNLVRRFQNDTEGQAAEEPAWSYPYVTENGGSYYRCKTPHRSESANEPGVGVDWEDVWELLGASPPQWWDYQHGGDNPWQADRVYAPWNRGFPSVCVFHDQRLIVMANKDNPTALYGSSLGAYANYVLGPEDDNAWIFVLDSSDTPKIKWAQSQQDLMLGTSSGDWRIGAEVTIAPTDIQAERQNNARSHLGKPAQIDTEIFYIEQGQRKMRVTQYRRNVLSFSSTDATLLSEHLFEDDAIVRMFPVYTPEVMLILVLKNGQTVMCTYEKQQNVLAYTQMDSPGRILDGCGYFSLGTNQDYQYFVVERQNGFYLERMNYPRRTLPDKLNENGIVHLDSWVSGVIDPEVPNRVAGLERLEGQKVSVLIDDAWIGEFTVQNGIVDIVSKNYPNKPYVVGLSYKGYAQTFEVTDNFQGTGFGAKRRWVDLRVRLLDSALPRIYSQIDPDRTPQTKMGEAETVRPGIQDVKQAGLGYGDGSLIIEQDRPYPTHVLGFFGDYQVEDR